MTRIAVVGRPGSGKVEFSKRLGEIMNLPVHSLDDIKAPRQALATSLLPVGIVVGNHSSGLAFRILHAEKLFVFDFSRRILVWRLVKRKLSGNLNLNHEHVWNVHTEQGKQISFFQEHRKRHTVTFKHPREVRHYLRRWELARDVYARHIESTV
jgi:adenylate kinase family enzyme